MKTTKILVLILAFVMSLTLAACGKAETADESDAEISPATSEKTSEPITTSPEPITTPEPNNSTEQSATAATEMPTETSEPTTLPSSINETQPDSSDDSPNKYIDSATVDEFEAFIESEKAKGIDLSPYFLLPRTSLPGYELDSVSYEMNGDISDVDGGIWLTYKDTNNEAQNANMPKLTYFICTWNYDLAKDSLHIAAANGKRVNIEDREIYYQTDSDYYVFTFIHDYKLVSVIAPFVDGLDATDMVKYLDMVNVT